MQVTESKASNQAIPTGRRCTVCEHDSLNAIDSLLCTATLSNRRIAKQFGFSSRAVDNHAKFHLPAKIAKAAARKQEKTEDVFMERHEHLYREALQYIEDAKGAVKMQKVTAEIETDHGITLQDRYQPFRDVGAMAPAIGAATALQRVLGDATARFSSQPTNTTNVHLSVIMPRAVEPELPACIDVTPVPQLEPKE